MVTSTLLWPSASLPQSLDNGCMHVWAWDFASHEQQLAAATSVLSPEEQRRMMRFHFERHRNRYAICHGNLRRILASYLEASDLGAIDKRDSHLQLQPSQLQFEENSFGKPRLSGRQIESGLNFNLSHTTDVALLAVGRNIEIGVDVEQIRPIEADIAEKYFSPRELGELANLAGRAWLEGFYNCWTRKEAILKAEGVGLSVRLNAFDVTLTPGAEPRLVDRRAEAGLHTDWVLASLKPCEDAAAAIATNYLPVEMRCWRL